MEYKDILILCVFIFLITMNIHSIILVMLLECYGGLRMMAGGSKFEHYRIIDVKLNQ